ncbi:MAG TPA: aspartate-alanine antiporter [Burkholderiaceae bacterium]|nr:aspartate-alanine antiporter [Burkholderiaceae bacterium]
MELIDFIVGALKRYPELAIFASLAIGYWIGAFKFGGFSLGAVTGTLLAAILIGQLGITVSPNVKSMFFIMFLFAVGYGVGPQFVRGIASDGLPQAIFAVVVSVLCLLSCYAVAIIAGYGPGFAAGFLAGSQTISAAMGVATDAISGLGLTPEAAKTMTDQMPVAYAVTYIWGTIGTGIILSILGPKLLGVDIAAECKRYEKEMSAGAPAGGMQSAYRRLDVRAYKIGDRLPAGTTVRDIESRLPDARIFVLRLRRDGQLVKADPTTVLQQGDVVAVGGKTDVLVEVVGKHGTEVSDPELLDMPSEAVDVVLTNKAYDGKTLLELTKTDFARGVYLNKITRGATSVNIPILAQTKVNRGDILRIAGPRAATDAAVKNLGYADRPTNMTDMVWVGLGIVLGGLIGAIVIPVSGIPITLSTSGGALIAGIIVGWARGVHPTFGRIPAPALWFMNSVGLNVFIAVVGITAGPTFVAGIKEAGFGLFLWGLAATSVPMLLAPLIGKYIFKFDPAINLGCCGGARTSTASVAMVADVAKSDIPMLGYTVPYAVSNTLLTMWGLVIVLMLA